MPILSNNTTVCNFYIKHDGVGFYDIPYGDDIVEEINLIGTERTVVNRYGFGSLAVEYSIYLSEAEYNKLLAVRAAQTNSNPVVYEGQNWHLTITSPPRRLMNRMFHSHWLDIRLKRI